MKFFSLTMNALRFRVSTTYTTPTSMGVPNAAAPYPQMLGLSAEQVQALMPAQTSPSTLLPHPQRHTPPVHNSSHNKYPPPLIPVNGSSNSSSGWEFLKTPFPYSFPLSIKNENFISWLMCLRDEFYRMIPVKFLSEFMFCTNFVK